MTYGRVAVALLLVAACGSGRAPTKAEYLRSLDAICRKADAEAVGLAPPDPADRVAVADYLARRRGITRRQLVALQQLRRPAGDAAAIDLVVRELAEQLGRLEAASVVADHGDSKATLQDLLERIRSGERAIGGAFTAYGADGCAPR